MLEAVNVKVRYRVKGGFIEALRGVTFRIKEPTLVTISGPSGSGKTTLLKAIAGKVNYEGSIRVLGLEVKDNRKLISKLTLYLPIGEVLIDDLTVDETIRLASMGNSDAGFIGDVINMLNIGGLLSRRVAELSTGERRRVELAVALIKGPRVMLIDEPTIGLDEANAHAIGELLRLMAKQGRLILVATHDPVLVNYSSVVLKIRDGVLM